MKKILILSIFIFTIYSFSQSKNFNLMPWPQEIQVGEEQLIINTDFTISVNQNSTERIDIATTKFLRRLSNRTGVFLKNGFAFYNSKIENPSLEISYESVGKLEVYEEESYELNITKNKISIKSKTDLGVIHALETLLQLVSNTETYYFFPEVKINDFPRFTWRGVMIDVARHFQPVEVLKRNIDAMSSVKLNVLHWHLTDDQGFRIESKKHPKLHELGSDGLYYTQNQIKEVVKYAADRGIRVVPEVDIPGHATAILTAYPEIASKKMDYSIERNSGIFDPTLNPINEKTYIILDDLFGEMAQLFPDKYFHIGGDENEGKHWDENDEIQKFKKEHNLITNHDLQTYFNIRLDKILGKYDKLIMGWEEIMTEQMPTSALIHSWRGANEGVEAGGSLVAAAKKGHYTVLSNGYYIDLMQPLSEHYLVDPMPKDVDLTDEEKTRILGGEATMWSELVTPQNIDSRIWPRTAAIAERFWSAQDVNDLKHMYKRLETVSVNLEELGITHIRNVDVILRNITNNQSISSLKTLTKIAEPIKIYTRNEGGTEYKTFSPFSLFADACTADAPDSFKFRKALTEFVKKNDKKSILKLNKYFDKWINGYESFNKLKMNPKLNNIKPLFENLASISQIYKEAIANKSLNSEQSEIMNKIMKNLKKPVMDVELAVYKDFKRLSAYLVNNK